jgi:hypothetical protein
MRGEPSNSNGDNPYKGAVTALREAIERNVDRGSRTAAQLDRTLISLSAGALLLSTTFVPTLAPKKLWLPLLFLAWLSFVASMILVIFAMRSAQSAVERAVQKAGASLKTLEKRPDIARQFIVEQPMEGIETPLTLKEITPHMHIAYLNLSSLIAFTFGVLCLAIFAGYNLWQTPAEQIRSQHINQHQ